MAYFDRLGKLGHKPNWVERILQGDGFFSKLASGRLEAAHDAQLVLGLRRKAPARSEETRRSDRVFMRGPLMKVFQTDV